MPRGDRTGPNGQGSMTGRRLGFCAGNDQPEFDTTPRDFRLGYGRGFGRRHGWGGQMGYGFRHGYGRFMDETVQNVSSEALLEHEARILKEQLASVEKQLSELKKRTD
ncbi:MAG: DUF5320 domain-containing protein [Bacteroidales bacterium]